MSAKRWLAMFCAAVAAAFLVIAAFNFIIDPFGVFGDRVLDRYSYNMTNNPQAAKIAYLERHAGEYDSFVIGSSTASAYAPEKLEKYLGGSFYNMFSYGANMEKNLRLVEYLIGNYNVRNIVLPFGLREAAAQTQASELNLTNTPHANVSGDNRALYYLSYLFCDPHYSFSKIEALIADSYLPQYFDCFVAETGVYDKKARDVEYMRGSEEYLKNNPIFATIKPYKRKLGNIGGCSDYLRQIRELCEANGVGLTVIFSPEYGAVWKSYSEEDIAAYRAAVAEVTDYWDFAYTGASEEARYFYDEVHSRNALGDMVLARIFEDDSVWYPDNFGGYVERGGVLDCASPPLENYTCNVPVLMFHHIAGEGEASVTVTPEQFEENIAALYTEGYNAVTPAQLADYVYNGTDLPEKPILITMDDGYYSNYEFAYPVLKKYGFRATINVIGVSFGKSVNEATGSPIIPHFGADEAREMTESGLVSIQSHSFDMHQLPSADTSVRKGVLQMKGESEAAYIEYFRKDVQVSINQIKAITGQAPLAFAFPFGARAALPDVLLREMGFTVTFSTDSGINTLVKGLPQTLLGLRRINVVNGLSGTELLAKLQDSYVK